MRTGAPSREKDGWGHFGWPHRNTRSLRGATNKIEEDELEEYGIVVKAHPWLPRTSEVTAQWNRRQGKKGQLEKKLKRAPGECIQGPASGEGQV